MMLLWRSGNNPRKGVLDKLQTLYLGGVEIQKEGVAVIQLWMDDGGGNGGGSFKVKHGSDASEARREGESQEEIPGPPAVMGAGALVQKCITCRLL